MKIFKAPERELFLAKGVPVNQASVQSRIDVNTMTLPAPVQGGSFIGHKILLLLASF